MRYSDKPSSWSDDEWQELLAFRAGDEAGQASEESTEESEEAASDVSLVDHLAAAAEHLHLDRSVLDARALQRQAVIVVGR